MAERNEARQKILDAALKVFSEKGYDGARTEAIAKRAGVNNALIYYYFKGKSDLMSTLVNEFYRDCSRMMMDGINSMDFRDHSTLDRVFEMFFEYLEDNEDMLRLVVVESLKKDMGNDFLFKFVDAYLGKDEEALAVISMHVGVEVSPDLNFEEVRITEFFTLIAPVVFYILYRDKWEKYYSTTKEDLRAGFMKALYETHLAAHHTTSKDR